MSRKRGRELTDAERALWQAVADTTKPIQPSSPPEPRPMTPARIRTGSPEVASVRPVVRPAEASRTGFVRAPSLVQQLGPTVPGLDRNTAERLRKGRLQPEARIDLHGFTAERAHRALIEFMHGARSKGLRCVLIITGKGKARDENDMFSETGVLRRHVPQWLGQPPISSFIVGVYPAHQRHGGGGAYYAYLRKDRAIRF